mmetsp:Transcript_38449/g.80530  ORF Transcript_38449/g.80530 Transcript_38449/m.80530 type:complete len:300 (+) Transcript_38449:200-1099(+)
MQSIAPRRLFVQQHDFDFAELNRMAFRLQRDRATGKHDVATILFDQHLRVIWFGNGTIVWIELRLFVFQNNLAIHDVLDGPVTVYFDLASYPLVATVGLGRAVDAVWLEQLAIHDHVGARGTQVSGRTITGFLAAQKLHFDRSREVLIFAHILRCFAMNHHTTIAECPAWTILALVADEAILQSQAVVAERLFVEQMAERFIEAIIVAVGIRYRQQTVFHAKRVAWVFASFVVSNLGNPAGQVFAVEQLNPFPFRLSCFLVFRLKRDNACENQQQRERKTAAHTHGGTSLETMDRDWAA